MNCLLSGGITAETRRESHSAAQTDAAARRRVILEILSGSNGMTAREVAAELHRRGITPTGERNYSAPRLTELKEAGEIEVTGKRLCTQTGRNVAVWRIRKGGV
jgi:predicted ArsR family transcriptional regulator